MTWDNFRLVHGASAREAFQLMGQLYLNAEVGARSKAFSPRYPGLEAAPVKGSDGKTYGFQAKFFDRLTRNSTKRNQIVDSLEKIRDEIDCLYIFCNALEENYWEAIVSEYYTFCASSGKSFPEIEWVVDIEAFKGWLLESDNVHILQLFFSAGRPIQLIDDQAQAIFSKERTLIETDLLTDKDVTIGSNVFLDSIPTIVSRNTYVIVQGNPGSGKTILFQEIYAKLARLDIKDNYRKRLREIVRYGIPIFIRARELNTYALSDRLSTMLATYGLKLGQLNLYILIDGLDELDFNAARRLIDDIKQVSSPGYGVLGTLVSVRAANRNKYLLDEVKSYAVNIAQLTDAQIRDYFVKKDDLVRLKRFDELWLTADDDDKKLVRDIHLVVKLHSIIDKISRIDRATILEQAYLYSTKNTTGLNLLDPQGFALREIHENISENLFYRQGVGLQLSELQEVILGNLSRLTYRDINDIINVLADGIFEDIPPDPTPSTIINYAHRSWVDFFAASKMSKLFKDDKSFLNEISQYEDFLKKMLLPVARNYYWSQRNVSTLISLGVIEHYLNTDSGQVGTSNPYETRVLASRFSPLLKERVALDGYNLLNQGYLSPSLALQYYKVGLKDIAERSLNNLHKSFDDKDEDAERSINESVGDFVALRLLIEGADAKKMFLYWQKNVLKNLESGKRSYFDEKHYDPILEELLRYGNFDIEWLLKNIKPSLIGLAIKPLIKVSRLKQIREYFRLNPQPLQELMEHPIDMLEVVGFLGLVADGWNDEIKELADKYIKELNEKKSYSLDGYKFAALRHGLLRILDIPHDRDEDLSIRYVSLNDMFRAIYNLMALDLSDINKTTDWLLEASSHSYYDAPYISSAYYYSNAELMAEILTDSAIETSLKSALFKTANECAHIFFNKTKLPIFIFKQDPSSLTHYYNYDSLKSLYQEASSTPEIGDSVNAALDFAPLFAIFDENKAISLIQAGQNLPILRYGYHKDVFAFGVLDGLEAIWKLHINDVATRREYSKEMYALIVKIQEITDHDETGSLPDQFFEMLGEYDLDLMEELCSEFLKENRDDNPVRSILIKAKIDAGHNIEGVKELIGSYHRHYYGQDQIDTYYFEQRFRAYIQIANSKHYPEQDRLQNLESAAAQIPQLKDDKYYHRDERIQAYVEIYYELRREFARKDLPNYPRKSKYKQDHYTDTSSPKAPSEQDYTAKIQGLDIKEFEKLADSWYSSNTYSLYRIVGNKDLSKSFIEKAESLQIPYANLKDAVEHSLTPWSIGENAVNFLQLLYKSPVYGNDFLYHISHTSHQISLRRLFTLFVNTNDTELIELTFKEVLACLKFVTRNIDNPEV